MNSEQCAVFSEEELKKIYFSLGKEILRKKAQSRLIANAFLLNVFAREVSKLEKLKNKVTKLINNYNNGDII